MSLSFTFLPSQNISHGILLPLHISWKHMWLLLIVLMKHFATLLLAYSYDKSLFELLELNYWSYWSFELFELLEF